MAGLKAAVLAAALLWASPAQAEPIDRWNADIGEASARFGIPEAWIRRVIRAESGGRTTFGGRPIVSRAGAMGLMQLMPGTWREVRSRLGLGRNPHQPRDNILAGTAYLRAMYDRFGYPGLFAAYNAGPARYSEHLSTGRGLPPETVAYVTQIVGAAAVALSRSSILSADLAPSGPPSLFAIRGSESPAAGSARAEDRPAESSLFFALGAAPTP
jgi:soluble lytic murein transglycosylase-like protein